MIEAIEQFDNYCIKKNCKKEACKRCKIAYIDCYNTQYKEIKKLKVTLSSASEYLEQAIRTMEVDNNCVKHYKVILNKINKVLK